MLKPGMQRFAAAQGVPRIFAICHADQMSANLNCTLSRKSEKGEDTFSVA
jgi:hypothetical protein